MAQQGATLRGLERSGRPQRPNVRGPALFGVLTSLARGEGTMGGSDLYYAGSCEELAVSAALAEAAIFCPVRQLEYM
jgi:hypothetical protein